MIKTHMKIAWRNMLKYKGYSLINVIGLSIGISVCFLLSLWIHDELSYDQFHKKSDRIYRMQWDAKYGDNTWTIPLVPMPLAGMMESEFPEVEKATQVYEGKFTVLKDGISIRERNVLFADQDFFDIFTIKTIVGDPKAAMENPDAIVLSEQTVERYFGKQEDYQNIIGKIIQRNDGQAMQVQAVVKAFPNQSHLDFDFIASLKNLKHLERRKEHWGSATLLTYFLLAEGGDPLALNGKVEAYCNQHVIEPGDAEAGNYSYFPFEQICQIHLKPNLSYIWIFGLVASIILLLACINFINLTTARAMQRAKEVGIRKVLGSNRGQLMRQFFSESSLYVLIAVLTALFIAEFALPYFNHITGKQLDIYWLSSPFVWGFLGTLVLVTAILTGSFPAFVLSSFSPVKVLKGQLSKVGRRDRFRQGLVIFQFVISCILITSTMVIKDQLHFLQNNNLGFNKDQVLVLRHSTALGNNYYPFLEKLKSNPKLERVSVAQYLPGDGFDSTIFLPEQPSNFEQTSLSYSHIDENYVDAMQLEIIEGRNFDLSLSTDSSACLINETAAERLGWDHAVGKKLTYGGFREGQVVGVVKDFNYSSLHSEVAPLVLCMTKSKLSNIFIHLQPGNMHEYVAEVQAEWKAMAPNAPFEFTFLDQELQELYKREIRMSSVFTVFVILAVFIGCLGLLALAAFMAERRTKEIGIRKIIGASVVGLVGLLSRDFLKLVLLAFLIAIPIAYYFMDQWLQSFAYRIEMSWGVFAWTAVLVLGVAALTVSFQSIKAAMANPGDNLRNE